MMENTTAWPSNLGARLAVRDLTHGFNDMLLLSLSKLDLEPATLTVLTGPSGCGKSTLLYLLAGLTLPRAGQIMWAEEDLTSLTEAERDRWRRTHAGFIFQDFHLLAELSPLDNVLLPIWFGAFSARTQHTYAESLLERFGVPRRARTAFLSRGEQQRVALARALVNSPAVLFADEPTASLDRETSNQVAATLVQLAHQAGYTVLVASHDPEVIAQADLRLQLTYGQPVELMT